MESSSPANRLPEADSLPDGFVESSAEPAAAEPPQPPPPQDYNGSLLDLDRPGDPAVEGLPLSLAPETLDPEGVADRFAKLATSADSSMEKGGLDSTQERIAVADRVAEAEGASSPRDERSCERETNLCLELHTASLKENKEENAERVKNQKDSSEPKPKVSKRGAKSEKELLEFTLKYQKVIAERDAGKFQLSVAVRERLESLCRELQRQNKMLMEECQRVSTEGQNMRLDLSTKFNNAIKDVSSKLEEQKDECLTQLRENEMLRNKLKHLADQYTLAEQQFGQKLKQKILELELADLKIQQHQERSAQEQTQMQLYAEQISQLMATEKSLRLQLAADEEKFRSFQDALSKSNDVFEALKVEMEKMVKLIKELKKENEFLKGKCEKSDVALVKLIEDRELMKKQFEKAKNQKEKLESLCRSLQAERKHSSAEGNADPVTIPLDAVNDP
ncbi:alpha-taxilin isoform X1 [Ananas comosus]|uniref:Alpha-taxilin isoform X1 n=1 Tax=Ananas comosus TaxID=4615 RepID=A0A6P5GRZ9_ANACO|nr:alpha-taxilin isoform X1 [Ananas comosus]